jgi:hypothetical protein
MIQFLLPALLAMRAFVAAGTGARSESTPWSYSFTVSPDLVASDVGRASVSFAPATSAPPSLPDNSLTAAPLTGSAPRPLPPMAGAPWPGPTSPTWPPARPAP